MTDESSNKASRMEQINKNGGNAIMSLVVLGLVAYFVVSCIQIKQEENNRTPEQVAGDNARQHQKDVAAQNKPLRDNAEEIVRDYMLASTGKGICDTLSNASMANVRYGSAVYQGAKREPAITGSYSADCTYYIQGRQIVDRKTYWFQMTMQSKTGQREGSILLDNPEKIQRGLKQTLFQQE